MPDSHYSDFDVLSGSSSAVTSDSFCLSTAESDTDPDSQASIDKLAPKTKPTLSSKPDPTIYSFAWSTTNSSKPTANHTESLSSMATSGTSFIPLEARASRVSKEIGDVRKTAPTLPRPKFLSSLTHNNLFSDYIATERLLSLNPNHVHPNTPSVATGDADVQPQQIDEPTAKGYTNISHIVLANTEPTKIETNRPITWVTEYLLGDGQLPVPFQSSLLFGDKELWRPRPVGSLGDDNFVNLPDLSSESTTMEWLINLTNSLGRLHGLRGENPGHTSQATNRGDRTFNCDGATKPLPKGLITRKPDIVVVDRTLQFDVPSVRLRWPLVQALIEITTTDKGSTHLVRTMMDKASNIFDSQLHRRYVLGLAIYGKGSHLKFIFVLIDRVGVACTTPAYIKGTSAVHLARIIFAFAYASDQVLGVDTHVSIDRFTGDPQSVVVGNQEFAIVTEIYASPYVFGRGTRVYVVRDRYGYYHILKDSWILSTHSDSEIEFIKKIGDTVKTEGLPERTQVLSPRFVAGDEHVHNTDEGRPLLTSRVPARIRRRIVTGPIGDPITSYRSRVECLQAMVDVIDQLKFMNDKCGVVHGDISINNIIIVRFLPNILAASPVHSSQVTANVPESSTAGQKSANSVLSSSDPPSTTTISPKLAQLFTSMNVIEGRQPVFWETKKTCTSSGLPYNLASGGSVIDFDYACAKDKIQSKTSGTLPYMAVTLMKPRKAIAHRLDHDLESVCYVLLHIARFTTGPIGTQLGKIRKSHRVAWWHHEKDIGVMRDNKVLDLKKIAKNPTRYLSRYWGPIAPYVSKIVKLFPAKHPSSTMDADADAIYQEFRDLLVSARDHCSTMKETPSNYAAFESLQPVQVESRKRSHPDGKDQCLPKSKRQMAESQVQSSVLLDSNVLESNLIEDLDQFNSNSSTVSLSASSS